MKAAILFLFLVGCAGVTPAEDVPEVVSDLGATDQAGQLSPGSPPPSGGYDKCVASDCDTPLLRKVEFSDPARTKGR